MIPDEYKSIKRDTLGITVNDGNKKTYINPSELTSESDEINQIFRLIRDNNIDKDIVVEKKR